MGILQPPPPKALSIPWGHGLFERFIVQLSRWRWPTWWESLVTRPVLTARLQMERLSRLLPNPNICVTSFSTETLHIWAWGSGDLDMQWTHAAPSRRLPTPPQWSGKSGVARFLWNPKQPGHKWQQYIFARNDIGAKLATATVTPLVKAAGGTATKGARTAKWGRTAWDIDQLCSPLQSARMPVWFCETLHFVVNKQNSQK